MADKYTRKQFQAQYPDDAACLQAVLQRRYGSTDVCPHCGVVGKITRIEGRRAFACKEGCHIYPCAGTVFEKSSTALTDWFYAMYLMTSTRNGVSAKELQRQLGVTYKCAWRIGHQIRELMTARDKANNPSPLSGHIEIDETYVGGKRKGKGQMGKKSHRTIVMGVLQREGAVKTYIVPNVQRSTLLPIVQATVASGSTISSDELSSYRTLAKHGYIHGTVDHSNEEWVSGIHHTNSIEGFWSHLKRGIRSTHASVSPKHLSKYVNEFAFRYNNRKAPAEMFHRMLKQISKPISS
jgi:transposase